MRFWIFLLLCLGLYCSCQKTITYIQPAAKDTLFPHVDRFSCTVHLNHEFFYSWPYYIYDTTYQQTIEVIYPDSNWLAFSFSFWDTQEHGVNHSHSLVTRSLSFVKRPDNHYTFDSAKRYVSHLTIVGDSLWIDLTDGRSMDALLTVHFSGSKM